jgi:hypothetical protein
MAVLLGLVMANVSPKRRIWKKPRVTKARNFDCESLVVESAMLSTNKMTAKGYQYPDFLCPHSTGKKWPERNRNSEAVV